MYNAADVFICPSRSEGWSNAIAESLACGTPVVATDVGGNAEQVCHPDLGRIVPDDNESALAASIAAALLRSWNRDVIASHGQQRNWTTVAAEVHQVFARILEQPTTTPVRNRATSIQPASPPALAVETFPLEAME
jgi:glycosyltransferase involved in cell wall biosynthesis